MHTPQEAEMQVRNKWKQEKIGMVETQNKTWQGACRPETGHRTQQKKQKIWISWEKCVVIYDVGLKPSAAARPRQTFLFLAGPVAHWDIEK